MEDIGEIDENTQFNTERAQNQRPVFSQQSERDKRPILTQRSERAKPDGEIRMQQFDTTTRASAGLVSNFDSFKHKFQNNKPIIQTQIDKQKAIKVFNSTTTFLDKRQNAMKKLHKNIQELKASTKNE